jgi:hypothetical protein
VNQAYVIATSTKVPVAGIEVGADTEKLLAAKEERAAKAKALKEKKAEAFFELQKQPKKKDASAERKALQTKVDGAIVSKLSDELKAYLKARFSLSKSQRPHLMSF